MPAVSLVFALVVGLWAAYLLPQWVRRRESLGASRTLDRHSERLRVLPRRRSGRTLGGPSSRPLLAGTQVLAPPPGPPVRAGARALGRPKPLPQAPVTRSLPATRTELRTELRTEPGADAARRRAVVLLWLVLAAVASWAAVLVPVVAAPTWVAAPATVLLGLDVLALRAAARRRTERLLAERRRQRVARIGREHLEPGVGQTPDAAARPRTVRPAGATARAASTASGRPATPRPSARPSAGPSARPSARPAAPVVAARPGWDDRRWEDETGEIVGIERPNPLAADDGWAPVAVPRPTYMSKPVVERPKPRPWTPDRDFADDLDLDAVLARRRAVNG